MSRIADDPGNYFQTTESIATTERKAAKSKNKHGNPIKLPSKILAIQQDLSQAGRVYLAEAAGDVKRLDLQDGSINKVFTQATAPITCLALRDGSTTLYAGCWDKFIYAVDLRNSRNKAKLQGHTDFVKCLATFYIGGDRSVLISGGADAVIIVWDLTTERPLCKLRGHTKAIQDLKIDPLSIPETDPGSTDDVILFSASSDREIRRWSISLKGCHELPESIEGPILAHETSVYRMCFDVEGDLWTASADKTAKHLVRDRGWEADTVLHHPDFVRDVALSEKAGLVITACRDEEVRVWDALSGDLVCTYSGHYEEVTGVIVPWWSRALSISIDGTVRSWGLKKQDMETYRLEAEKEGESEEKVKPKTATTGDSVMTAEEEAELAELMEDD